MLNSDFSPGKTVGDQKALIVLAGSSRGATSRSSRSSFSL